MPLCPQITITPVTVTTSGMTTVSVVDAGVPATTGQLDETAIEAAAAIAAATAAQADADAAQADAAAAISTATAAQGTANTALSNATAAQGTANTALSNAATAQGTANTALSNAATAQSTATAAAATATAANTAAGVAQSTADGKSKVTYSTSVPGTTPNSLGDIWYQYGTTAPNVGRIIAQFTGNGGTSWTPTTISGLVIANIDAGNITTGTLTAAVGISNPSGNFSVNGATGALVCTGATVTGNITATTGTFTGTVYANAGTFTGTVIATTGSFTGAVYASSGTFTGEVIATTGTFTGTVYASAGSFTGTVIATTGTFTGTVYANAGTFTGTVTATTGSFTGQIFATGGTFTGNITTNANIQTSSGTSSVRLSGTSNSLTFVTSGSAVGHMVPLGSGGILTHYGATADPSGGTFPQFYVSGTNALLAASNSVYISANSGGLGIQMQGNVAVNSTMTYDGAATASGSTLVLVTTGRRVGFVSSSRKTKKNIEPLAAVGFVDKLLTLEPVAFDWKDQPEDMPYRRNYGLIAEDVAALGGELESIVNYNADNEPVSISYDRLSTFLISAVKELKAEIELLKGA